MTTWTGPPPLVPPTDGSVSGSTLNNMLRRWRQWEEHLMTDVPDGTAAEVLDWVGDDPARADAALHAEYARPSPRSTLIAKLETIASKEAAVTEAETADTREEEPEEVPGPRPPARDELSIDLLDNATYIGPANTIYEDPNDPNSEYVNKPDDSYDLVQAQARADEADESPVEAEPAGYFQVVANSGVVVIRFDDTAVLLDKDQAAALSKDLRSAMAGVTY